MNNFMFHNPTKIFFGKDVHHQVGKETKKYAKKVLLHYGGGSIKQNGVYDDIVRSLETEGIEYVELSGVKPNPRLSLVKEGIKLCKEHQVDFILAVGGGSVIDSAKAIGIGTLYDGDVWDFFIGKARANQMLPLGTVLTIPAAGSESSNSTVITNEEGWFKKGHTADCMFPAFSFLNPEHTFTLSNYQTGCGLTDMFSHVLERYFTQTQETDYSDRLCEATMRAIIHNGLAVTREPNSYAARAEVMWAGTLAHNNLIGMGRDGDWATHNIEHELSGIYDIAHGAGLAIMFPAWMTYVLHENLDRFVQYAVRVWDVDLSYQNREAIALEGIRRTKQFFAAIGMPTSLQEANIDQTHFEEMARKATEFGPFGSFKQLTAEDVVNIYNIALENKI